MPALEQFFSLHIWSLCSISGREAPVSRVRKEEAGGGFDQVARAGSVNVPAFGGPPPAPLRAGDPASPGRKRRRVEGIISTPLPLRFAGRVIGAKPGDPTSQRSTVCPRVGPIGLGLALSVRSPLLCELRKPRNAVRQYA